MTARPEERHDGDDRPDPDPSPPGDMNAEHVLAELADMQLAHEELRVAEEQMRAQQEQITALLLQHDAERRWRGQMSAVVPVGLCVTDGNGLLVDANQALAAHLGTGLHRLRGKPLPVFLATEDARRFRSALRDLGVGDAAEQRLSVTLTPRHLRAERAQLFGFPERTDHRASEARIQWVLVPEEMPSGPAAHRSVAHTARIDQEAIPASDVVGLAGALAELAMLPIGELDRQRLLTRMAALVREAVPAAEWVSITLGSPIEPQRLGSDSAEAQTFDGWQARAGEGPGVDAYATGTVVATDDVTADPRWPTLAGLARGDTVRSVLAVPVRDDGAVIGGLNLYSGETAAFGPAGRRIGELTAAAVAGVLQNVEERESMQSLAENLERALTSRAVIDQAKGMIMARLEVDAEEAFARLVKLSSRLNVKVRDLAALIVEGHVDAVLRTGG
jgi:putative methionine-R-sulfoxide reductase with GAF domain